MNEGLWVPGSSAGGEERQTALYVPDQVAKEEAAKIREQELARPTVYLRRCSVSFTGMCIWKWRGQVKACLYCGRELVPRRRENEDGEG